jgi:hypothetical protein
VFLSQWAPIRTAYIAKPARGFAGQTDLSSAWSFRNNSLPEEVHLVAMGVCLFQFAYDWASACFAGCARWVSACFAPKFRRFGRLPVFASSLRNILFPPVDAQFAFRWRLIF